MKTTTRYILGFTIFLASCISDSKVCYSNEKGSVDTISFCFKDSKYDFTIQLGVNRDSIIFLRYECLDLGYSYLESNWNDSKTENVIRGRIVNDTLLLHQSLNACCGLPPEVKLVLNEENLHYVYDDKIYYEHDTNRFPWTSLLLTKCK